METWRYDWANSKGDIALRLNARDCGGSYGESVIILCAVLSALAADVWPGRGIDRARFVELLKVFVPESLNVTRISIPLLVAFLRNDNRNEDFDLVNKTFLNYQSSQILIGDEVDKSESEILNICNRINLKDIRKHSYANLLYNEIRSGYAHEYRPGERADSWPMTDEITSISYINWADKPDRNIHFHVHWIYELTLSAAKAVDAVGNSLPKNAPANWWIYGKK